MPLEESDIKPDNIKVDGKREEGDSVIILSSELIASVMESYFNTSMFKLPVSVVDLSPSSEGYAFTLAFNKHTPIEQCVTETVHTILNESLIYKLLIDSILSQVQGSLRTYGTSLPSRQEVSSHDSISSVSDPEDKAVTMGEVIEDGMSPSSGSLYPSDSVFQQIPNEKLAISPLELDDLQQQRQDESYYYRHDLVSDPVSDNVPTQAPTIKKKKGK